MEAVTCVKYLVMKIPTLEGVINVKGCQTVAKECYLASVQVSEQTYSVDEIPGIPDKVGRCDRQGKTRTLQVYNNEVPKELTVGDTISVCARSLCSAKSNVKTFEA